MKLSDANNRSGNSQNQFKAASFWLIDQFTISLHLMRANIMYFIWEVYAHLDDIFCGINRDSIQVESSLWYTQLYQHSTPWLKQNMLPRGPIY